jgi:murein L,D-transpeptidase YcbB/YkuD
MKRFLIYLLASGLIAACGQQNNTDGAEMDEAGETKKNISSRDYSITKANAYSDIFLDSMALEEFLATKKLPDSVARRMRSFYNARNYGAAWFSSDGLTEQARGFWNLHEYHRKASEADSVLSDKDLAKRMNRLIAAEDLSPKATNASIINTELTLTQHFIHYMRTQYDDGYIKRKEMERFVPRKKEDARYLADSLLSKKHKDNKYFEDVHKPYGLLKEQLGKYLKIVTAGGWPQVPATDKKLKPGESTPAIAIMKKRLQITGDMPGGDTSAIFTDTLAMGIRNFQGRHGLKEDGTISQTLIKEMNVPAEARLQQILMNMGRMRWLPPQPTGNLILVNIPEFMLHAYEGAKKAFDMVVVVGKEGHNTTTFTGDLNQVVFSPYWNVPESIVEKEILPAMARNASYLENQNMEIVSQNGSLPTIRQKPGQNNALGKVKFLFPNSFDIYFHDTPSKSLFERSMRAFSHGCIRLAEPEKMANYLLRNQPEWTPKRISEAMNKGEEEIVKLKDAVPVVITYYTAWVDDRGRLNFRDDIYGHDKKLAAKMFHSPAPGVSKVKDSAAVALR